ncbi:MULTISPECIES: hypothetical protein [unclassified Sphingomonas]|uniref:hypothetical protein n=1 Tax=unclassified Sphingomonas TaxID=196159 RepID=UPI00226A01EE|nr:MULTISPECIES: hypothetical protein [unclassified Sphingomonas]
MADRATLPHWPRLMRIDLAAQYLGVSASTFRGLAITPQNIGACVVYDRQSLDRFADHLAGQPLTPEERSAQSADVERAFLQKRRRG